MKRHSHPGAAVTFLLLAALWLAPRHSAGQVPSKPTAAGEPAAGAIVAPREIFLPHRGGRHGMCPAFTRDGAWLLWWDGKGIAIWDIAQEKVVGTVEPAAWQFVVSTDGKKVATDMPAAGPGRGDPVIKVYDVATRKEVYQFSRPAGGGAKEAIFRTCGFDRAADKLFTRTDLDMQVWDLKSGKMLRRINAPKPPYNNPSSLSPDGQYLTVDCGQAAVHVLDTGTEAFLSIRIGRDDLGKVLGKSGGDYGLLSPGSWSFSGDGRSLYGADQFHELLLEWSLPQAMLVNAVKIPGRFATVSADTTRVLVTYGRDDKKILRVLDRKTQRLIATLGPMSGIVAWYAISPDNRWVYGSTVGDTRLWDLGGPSAPAEKK